MYNQSSRKRSTSRKWSLLLILILLALAVCLNGTTMMAQGPGDGSIAVVIIDASGIEWQPQVENDGLVLTISGPDGLTYRQEFEPGSVPTFEPVSPEGQRHPDGTYTYELQAVPVVDAETRAALITARESGDSDAVVEQLQEAGKLPQYVQAQSGYFTIMDGTIVTGGVSEGPALLGPLAPQDIVHLDDVIIDGSLCVGFDCVNGESFGFDTIRLKENNLRIKFQDTSSTASFPTNDWQITANDSANGGANKFSIDDIDSGRTPFTIEAGTRANALYVDDSGRVGLGTSTPAEDLHIWYGDTPTIRLHQSGSGWAPQTWDVAGNEANFFIRDVTNGSRLPFRIQPGAPSSSLCLMSDGKVGFGTWSPSAPMELETTGEDAVFVADRTDGATAKLSAGADKVQFGSVTTHSLEFVVNDSPVATLNAGGNLTLDGALTELSDVNAKESFAAVDGEDVLARLADIPITTWNYIADDDTVRHMGPMAQDFYAAFALGPDERHIAPLDANGVALAAAQELYQIAQAQETQIAQLAQQNADLAARVAALEALVEALLQAQQE